VYVCAHTCTIYCNDANLVTYAVDGEEEEDEEEEALFKTKGGVGRGSYKMMVAFRPQ
jgi:hypothetical protein